MTHSGINIQRHQSTAESHNTTGTGRSGVEWGGAGRGDTPGKEGRKEGLGTRRPLDEFHLYRCLSQLQLRTPVRPRYKNLEMNHNFSRTGLGKQRQRSPVNTVAKEATYSSSNLIYNIKKPLPGQRGVRRPPSRKHPNPASTSDGR
ncbi:hypothetical protein E2C01_076407 [Portunus trituberculatus]|uniref:Uncharacterized protein n=1 Tax=Portunus trituberculatus TaxID=210409 RepID=A0A5B7IHK8_PORTR|nr:hypothetical protein [Portunus trituberculatus]